MSGVFEITLDGQKRSFALGKTSQEEFFAWRAAVKKQLQEAWKSPIQIVNETIMKAEKNKTPLSPTLIQVMMDTALRQQSSDYTPTESQIQNALESLESVRWLTHYKLARIDNTITREMIAEAIPDQEAAMAVLNKLGEVEGYHPSQGN